MKKWVIGIILSLSVTFMIGILNVSAYAIDLPTQSSYEQARHLWDDSWSVTSNGKMNQLCFYVGNDSDTSGNVYCVFNSWPMQLSTNSNYINSNNLSGYYYYRQYRFAANRGYDPNMIYDKNYNNITQVQEGMDCSAWVSYLLNTATAENPTVPNPKGFHWEGVPVLYQFGEQQNHDNKQGYHPDDPANN